MAIRRALEGGRAPQLREFLLPNVVACGKLLGRGSYGIVQKLDMDGLPCAGKSIYDTLIDPENHDAVQMMDKYYSECSLLSKLRHPHIVQFLGICFLPDSQLPVLVMELLHQNLDHLLETTPDIPLCTKLSILQDVARGLVYLHNHSPAVIHRDLTARNVLLDSAMVAKIADLGNSRMVPNFCSGKMAQAMTKGIPGTAAYMPPESFTQHYGPPLDMFSFGHLTLFAAIQVFPGDLLPATYTDPHKEGEGVRPCTELERRECYTAILDKKLGDTHAMVTFIKECLAFEPEKRPTAREALERLGAMRGEEQDPYEHKNRLFLEKIIAAEIEALNTCRESTAQMEILAGAYRTNRELLLAKDAEIEHKLEVCQGMDAVLITKEREIEVTQRALSGAQQQLEKQAEEYTVLEHKLEGTAEQLHSLQVSNQKLQTQLDAAQGKIQKLEVGEKGMVNMLSVRESHITALCTELKEKGKLVKELPRMLVHNLPLSWKRMSMPSGVIDAQMVVLDGKVYIGGGGAESNDYLILEYTINTGLWKEMETPVMWFGMAVVKDRLIITGGQDRQCSLTNQVWVLDNGTWTQPFPAMPTARRCSSAVGYKGWLLVVGGSDGDRPNCVEVLDTNTKCWFTASPTPTDASRYLLTVIQDTLYVAWRNTIFSVSIPILISDAMLSGKVHKTVSKWQRLPNTLTFRPAITSFHGYLFTVGAWQAPSSAIAMYLPLTEQWLSVAQLPTPRCVCTCVFLPETAELMVVGGAGEKWEYIKAIDIAQLELQ